MWRAMAVGLSVILATVSGVITSIVTQHPSRGLWAALGVLTVIGAALQALVTVADRRSSRKVVASGAGSAAIGGSAAEIRTQVRGSFDAHQHHPHGDVVASGPGAISVGGDASGPISTEVTGTDGDTKQ
jgi:hypothetical protein